MHAVVVANGVLPSARIEAVRSVIDSADLVIAADGGILVCRAVERWPDRLVGDLDSVSAEMVSAARDHGVEIVEFPTDKDETDLELALGMVLDVAATSLTVCTPFGGRLDHELAGIALLASPRLAALDVEATDGRRHVHVVRTSVSLGLEVGSTVSLIPWAGPAAGVTTTGLRWPLRDATLPLGSTWGISNVATDDSQSVSLTSGVLLAVSDDLESTGDA